MKIYLAGHDHFLLDVIPHRLLSYHLKGNDLRNFYKKINKGLPYKDCVTDSEKAYIVRSNK